MSEPEYIELNMSNYDDEDVSQLNQWGIWAVGRIEDLETISEELKAAIVDSKR